MLVFEKMLTPFNYRWFIFIYCCAVIVAGALAYPKQTSAAAMIFGVNAHAVQRYSPEEWQTLGEQLASLQVPWVREEFYWDRIEPTQGTFAWDGYEDVTAMYKTRGINVLGLLDYSSQWASVQSAAVANEDRIFASPDLTAWGNYVSAVVTRYKDTVKTWEIWNEPDTAYFLRPQPGAAAYLPILKTAYTVIKAADPTATVVTGGTAGVNYSFVKNLYLQGGKGYFDAIGVHAYRTLGSNFRSSPLTSQFSLHSLDVDLAALNAVVAANDPGRPIWITEFGWPTHDAGVSEAQQAAYVQQAAAIASSQGIAAMFWYDFRNDSSGSVQEQSFGLLQHDWTPKSAAQAFLEWQQQMVGATFVRWESVLDKKYEDFSSKAKWTIEQWQQGAVRSRATARVLTNKDGPKTGERAVLLYDFRKSTGSTFSMLTGSFPRSYNTNLAMWYLGDGSMYDLRVRFMDAKGETFQLTVGPIGKGWQRVEMDLSTVKNRMTSWGAKADGKVDLPIRLLGLLVDKSSNGSLARGSIGIGPITIQPAKNILLGRWQKPTGTVWVGWADKKGSVNTRTPVDRPLQIVQAGSSQTITPVNKRLSLPFDIRPLFLH
jgi:GH35 family endo-1,4-beta-xylanase